MFFGPDHLVPSFTKYLARGLFKATAEFWYTALPGQNLSMELRRTVVRLPSDQVTDEGDVVAFCIYHDGIIKYNDCRNNKMVVAAKLA